MTVSKAWNRNRLNNFVETIVALVFYVAAAGLLTWLVVRFG